jgi:hypothetical protein
MKYRLQNDYDNVIDLIDNLLDINTFKNSDTFFNWCVDVLIFISNTLNISYEEANILIFVIIHPIITMILALVVLKQRRKIKRLS